MALNPCGVWYFSPLRTGFAGMSSGLLIEAPRGSSMVANGSLSGLLQRGEPLDRTHIAPASR